MPNILDEDLECYDYLGYANAWYVHGGKKPNIVTECNHQKEFRGNRRICHACKFFFDADDSD